MVRAMLTKGAIGLRRWRATLGLSQAEAAALIPVHRRMYSRYEAGESIPVTGLLRPIERATGGEVTMVMWTEAADAPSPPPVGPSEVPAEAAP